MRLNINGELYGIKEVEELTRKQLVKALQSRKPASEFKEKELRKEEYAGKESKLSKILKKLKIKNESVIIEAINSIQDGQSIGFNKKLQKVFEMAVGEIFENIRDYKDLTYLIIDGVLSKRLLSIAVNLKLKFVACKNKENKLKIPSHISIYFF